MLASEVHLLVGSSESLLMLHCVAPFSSGCVLAAEQLRLCLQDADQKYRADLACVSCSASRVLDQSVHVQATIWLSCQRTPTTSHMTS